MSEKPGTFKILRLVCVECAEFFDALATGKATGVCPACEQVNKWMQESNNDHT